MIIGKAVKERFVCVYMCVCVKMGTELGFGVCAFKHVSYPARPTDGSLLAHMYTSIFKTAFTCQHVNIEAKFYL